MKPTKTLSIFTKNPEKIEVINSEFLEKRTEGSVSDGLFTQNFKVYPPQVYSLKTPQDVLIYLEAVLQDNYKYSFIVNEDTGVWNLTIDGIEFHVHKQGFILATESGISVSVDSDLPRNNLKLYQKILPLIRLEKQMAVLKESLKNSGLEGSFHIKAAKGGFSIECFSYPDDSINFELFFYTETNVLKFLHLLHAEGETYYHGDEPYKLSEIYSRIERLQRLAEQYRTIEKKINSISINL